MLDGAYLDQLAAAVEWCRFEDVDSVSRFFALLSDRPVGYSRCISPFASGQHRFQLVVL